MSDLIPTQFSCRFVNMTDKTVEKLRASIFNLKTRRFGAVTEIMIKKMLQLKESDNISHDLYDDKLGERVEVKFCTAMKANKNVITEENILSEIIQVTNEDRIFNQEDWKKYPFDCNIQQIKRKKFDVLYYGIFFADVIEIFKIRSKNIDENINYSDKQHAGNVGEGQFHLNNKTYEYHKAKHFFQSITYEYLANIL